jgi:TPR repeat protein
MSDKPVLDYYVKGDQHGNLIKLRIADNSPVWETPTITERKVDYKDGTAWQYYHKNGLSIALTNSVVNDYGKWHKINVVIANNSMLPIEFNPTANITASSNDAEGLATYLEVWSSEEYIRKVNRAQTFAAVMMGVAEGMAAANAGYSTSTTRSYHSGNIYSHGSRTHSYAGTSVSRRVTYNAYAAYQANVLASARMADYCYTLEQEQKIKELGYLKTNTIYPGESVSGYVHIKRAKGETVQFIIDIHGAKYTFDWRLGKKRSCIPSESTTTESIKNYIQSPTIQSLIDSNITRLSSLQIDKVLTTYTALGDSYLNASGDENLKRAFLCYYLGAKQNEPEAFYILATYYETGFNQGDFKIKSDLKLAGFLYATAAKLGVAGAREKANSLR